MAKNQSQTPGRDIRGGNGKRRPKGTAKGAAKGGKGASARGEYGRYQGQGSAPRAARQGRPGSERADAADVIFGRRAVAEALDLGLPLKSAFVLSGPDADATLTQLAARLAQADVPLEQATRQRLDELCARGAHQGIVVRTQPFEYASLGRIIRAAGEGDALVVVLDHVTDQGNLGAIVRSAEVVGAAGVVIANARAAGVGMGAYKASAGAVLHIPIARVPNLTRAIEELKEQGFWALAATEHAEQDIWAAPVEGRLALVMGSEGDGISQLVLKSCDMRAKLPQRGRIESLNVAQATTVFCYEWLRRTMAGE